MNTKTKKIAWMTVCIIILCAIVLTIFLITRKDNNKSDEMDLIKSSLSDSLNCIIDNEYNNSKFHYLNMYGEIKEKLIENEIPRAVAKNISYSIESVEFNPDENGNSYALVKTNFKSVDMLKLISEVTGTENYRQEIIHKIDNNEYDKKDFDIQVVMILHDDIWYLYETPALNDVFMGGLYSIDMAAREEFFNEISKESNTND